MSALRVAHRALLTLAFALACGFPDSLQLLSRLVGTLLQ